MAACDWISASSGQHTSRLLACNDCTFSRYAQARAGPRLCKLFSSVLRAAEGDLATKCGRPAHDHWTPSVFCRTIPIYRDLSLGYQVVRSGKNDLLTQQLGISSQFTTPTR